MKRLSKSFTQQEPIPETGIERAIEIMRTGRLHRYNVANGDRVCENVFFLVFAGRSDAGKAQIFDFQRFGPEIPPPAARSQPGGPIFDPWTRSMQLLCPDRRDQAGDADDRHHALHVVGQYVQRHFSGNVFECFHLEVRGAHPRLNCPEWVFDGFAA